MGAQETEPSSAVEPTASVVDFDAFYASEFGPLFRLAYVLTGSRGVAEELAQEAMLRALRHWQRVRDYELPSAWTRRVLLNLVSSRGRRLAAEARAFVRLRGDRPVEGTLSDDTTVLWDAVRSLPAAEAEALALHYLEDMSVVDMAEVLGRPEGTVKTLLHRARRLLAEKLGEEEP